MPEDSKLRIIIVGAGKAGELLSAEIIKETDSPFEIVCFVDDDVKKQNKTINGIKVLGNIADLRKLVRDLRAHEVFITIPSERGKVVRNIVEATVGMKVVYKILPRLSEVLLQNYDEGFLKFVRRVKPEDLLGGEILKSDQQEITDFAKGQVIMITGAAGSIGSELSRQISAYKAKKVIFYDWWENGMFELSNQLRALYPKGNFVFVIGDIKDRRKLNMIMAVHKPTTVFHAAAYKHVPLMEDNPAEAIRNNIVGTKNVAELSIRHKIKKFVLVSSDKAVNPTNIMGATKRAAEKVIHILSQSQNDTILCAVRFGNVINSNGSVIPIFEKQIETGGPVGITHKDITRFFMTIPEAVHLILQSWVMGQNNDLFVLDMGEPIRIFDLAKLLITLQGYIPETDIKINVIGLRPGEKLYEEVLVKEEETRSTIVKKIFRTQNYMSFNTLVFINSLNLLIESLEDEGLNTAYLKGCLQRMIPTYKPAKHGVTGARHQHAENKVM